DHFILDKKLQITATMTLLPGSQFTHFAYNPNVAANACYIAILSFCLLVQLIQGVRYRTWDFMGPMLAGILLELMGYTARIFMHNNPSSREAFLV
ncbi:phospholipid-translocating ATPase rsb1, partial [Exophiala xenobiotica]